MKFLFLFLLPLTAFSSPKLLLPWQWYSDPAIMSIELERRLDKIPLEGKVEGGERFWSGDYWALNRGNINYRWNSSARAGFKLKSPTLDEARRMTRSELAALSPSEKYDIFTGRFDYPVRKEVEGIANRRAESWEGICHGWAPASMNHQEPLPKDMVSPDGIIVPFGSSDIKALISYYYANGFVSDTHQMGRRCYDEEGEAEDCKEDMNAGAFHLILTNKISFRQEGIIVDIKRGTEVWNHPLKSYRSEILKWKGPKRSSARGTVKRAKVRTLVRVIHGTNNYWNAIRQTDHQQEGALKYVYWLDLDVAGNIIGGEWDSDERPDFLWVKYAPEEFTGNLARLRELLND